MNNLLDSLIGTEVASHPANLLIRHYDEVDCEIHRVTRGELRPSHFVWYTALEPGSLWARSFLCTECVMNEVPMIGGKDGLPN